jgi:hypothetical protein
MEVPSTHPKVAQLSKYYRRRSDAQGFPSSTPDIPLALLTPLARPAKASPTADERWTVGVIRLG